ncbi:MAG TPA: TIGR04222 domain-containing membrane protein [Thermoanaerobaculia bacterium]|nr:TIGR04222 domain-containing membrane protein [Thermoanaerobaculia bacterium]
MNPLDLTGPEFLQFYLVYGVVGLLLAWMLRRSLQRGFEVPPEACRLKPGHYPGEEDTYAVALLRGGRHALDEVRELAEARAGGERSASPELDRIESDLERQGLLIPPDGRSAFRWLFGLTLVALPGLGLAKLAMALLRGRPNIGFLLLLIALYALLTIVFLHPPRVTVAAMSYLAWLREARRDLEKPARGFQQDHTSDLVLAAAIFGPTTLLLSNPERRRDDSYAGGGCSSGGSAASGLDHDSGEACDGGGDGGGGCDGGGGDGGGGDGGGGDGGGGGGCGGGGCGGCGGG